MRRTIAPFYSLLILLLGPPYALRAESEPTTMAMPASISSAQGMMLQRWRANSFHSDYNARVRALSGSHGDEQIGVLLDAAELYLSHMLVYEAVSVLDDLTPLRPEHRARHVELLDAAHLLEGQPVVDFATSPLISTGREDAAFWRSLQGIAAADFALLDAHILDGFSGLGMQSNAVLRAMLPVFVEVAIELDHRSHADAGLRLMAELPDLAAAPVGQYLRGRSQEKRGNDSTALEAYFQATEGWDLYAVRARLAIADMSLSNGGRGALLAAKSTLSDGAEAWRGGRYELEVLKRLARVSEAVEDTVDALMTLGRILSRFPSEAEAQVAQTSAERLLAAFYQSGVAGDVPIADWMDVHLRLLSFYRTQSVFAEHTETFADYLLRLGATDLAMQEYRRALGLVREAGATDEAAAQQQVFRLNLKIAEAQLRAGLAEDARITLQVMSPGMGAEDKEAHAALRARVLAEVGDNPALIAISVERPTPHHLRALSQALMEERRWDQAGDVLKQFWAEFPGSFSVDDATALLIAAHRSEDRETRARVVRSFPSLTPSQPLIELAQSLDAMRHPILPLRKQQAASMLENLQSAFESIDKTTNYP